MEKRRAKYVSVILILAVFLLLTVALLGQYGWMRNLSVKSELNILDNSVFDNADLSGVKDRETAESAGCLYVWDSEDENSNVCHEQITQIFQDMKVDYREIDLRDGSVIELEQYDIIVLGFTNYQENSELLLAAVDWMEAGGSLFLPQVPEGGSVYDWMSSHIGVMNMGKTYYSVSGIRIEEDFMLTGGASDYKIMYPFESALPVELNENCSVYIVTADEREIPVLWETQAEKGHVVAVNLGHYEKSYRGIYAMAYSLLSEYCVWPVVNSASFYLDGFPFPLPSDKNGYITDAYGEGMDTYSFYVREWWNDLLSLAGKYGIRYTGTIVENNDDEVEPPYEEKNSANRYQYFISSMLEAGGEAGMYGYNQQPLCLETSSLDPAELEKLPDYEKDLKLNYWNSVQDMADGLREAVRFCQTITEDITLQVYTPPSGILSEEGKRAVKEALPDIRSIAGSYFGQGYAAEQEYEVDENGMILTPRITSGCNFDESMKMSALSELNMHYVASHAMSPLDVLNPDAGAELGWPALYETLENYEKWLEGAAGNIRKHTGSEAAAAVQRFYYAAIDGKPAESGTDFYIDNFQDEAWFLIRFNKWEPEADKTEGGELFHLTGNLYLLKAEAESISVVKKG